MLNWKSINELTRGSLHHDTMHKLKVASDARVKLNFEFCSTCNFWCECGKLICVIWMRFPEKRQQHASIMWKQRKSLSLHSHSLNPRSCIHVQCIYNIRNWNRCLQYNRLLCHGLTVTNPPMHEYYMTNAAISRWNERKNKSFHH